MPAVRLRWEPKPAFGGMLKRLKNKRPLYLQLNNLMIAMVNETHQHAGMPKWKPSQRAIDEGSLTGRKSGHLWNSWRPVSGKARIENRTAYAVDFYHGHGARTVQVPASYRRIRRTAKLYGQTRRRKQTVAVSMVKAHTKRERPQPARPIKWTRRYIKKAERKVLEHVLK